MTKLHTPTYALLLLLLATPCKAARSTDPTDSLRRKLTEASSAQRPKVLYRLARHFMNNNLDSALHYAGQALQASRAVADSAGIAKAYRMRGYVQMYQGKLESAIADLSRGLLTAEHLPPPNDEIALFLLSDLGMAHYRAEQYGRAMNHCLQYLSRAEERGSKRDVLIALNNVGVVYNRISDFRSALTYYRRALKLYLKEAPDKKESILTLKGNIGSCYTNLGEYDSAFTVLRQVLVDCAGGDCSPGVTAHIHQNLGINYFQQHRYAGAKREFTQGLSLVRGLETEKEEAGTLLQWLARIAINEDRPARAVELLERARRLRLAGSDSYRQEGDMDNHRIYADAYEAMGQYKKALQHSKRYQQILESRSPAASTQAMALLQARRKEKKNMNTIADQKRTLTLREEKLAESRQRVVWLSTAGGGILAVVLWLGWVHYRKRKVYRTTTEQNIALKDSNTTLGAELKISSKELGEAAGLIESISEELRHLMHQISHDIRGPIATIQGLCSLGIVEGKGEKVINYFNMVNGTAMTLDSILTRLNRTIEINNEELEIETVNLMSIFKKAWEDVDENKQLQGSEGIPKNFNIRYDVDPTMTVESSGSMLRALLETVFENTVKFRKMSRHTRCFVKISATQDKSHTTILVVDNGIGVPKEARKSVFKLFVRGTEGRTNTGGVGLYLASVAARRIGATMKLGITEQGYTELVLKVPKKFISQQVFFQGKKVITWMPKEEHQESDEKT